MSESKITPRAKEVYDNVCRFFDKKKFVYNKKDEELFVSSVFPGDDASITVNFLVDDEREILIAASPLPFKIKDERIAEFTFALAGLSSAVYNGWFVYDLDQGTFAFRTTAPYMGATVSEEMAEYLFSVVYFTVNTLMGMFIALNDGKITIEQFFEKLQNTGK